MLLPYANTVREFLSSSSRALATFCKRLELRWRRSKATAARTVQTATAAATAMAASMATLTPSGPSSGRGAPTLGGGCSEGLLGVVGAGAGV